MKAYNESQITYMVNNLGYDLLNIRRKDASRLRVVLQDSLGYKYDVFFNSIFRNTALEIVGKSNPFSIENIYKWLKLNNKNFDLLSDKFVSSVSKLTFKCRICDEEF